MSYELNRIMAEIPRAAEYFSIKELQAQTGQPFQNFASVIVKELVDNALDASESLVQPEVELDITETPDYYIISVRDYGPGFPEEAITGILDFNNRVSTKTIYAAPTRGAQGNALKTVIGIPIAMNCSEPILIESGGKKHILSAFMDPAGAVRTHHSVNSSEINTGTKVTVTIPNNDQKFKPASWAEAFNIFNPHAFVKVMVKHSSINLGKLSMPFNTEIYKPITDNFKKHTVRDLTSPWWYTPKSLASLVFSHINHGSNASNKPLGEFIRTFKGLTSTKKAKAVLEQLPGIKYLTDFEQYPELISDLLATMKSQTQPPKPEILGIVGKENFQKRFCEIYYSYFSQSLLTEYQAIYGPITLLYYDPRGYLYEPHTQRAIPLGTIEVREYEWPSWLFNKILYVEKKGLLPTLQVAQLAERYDIAIIAAEGYATEAARDLISKAAHDRQYKIFVLHDADPAGYEISRTLSEETKRMPGYSLEVVDLGLRVQDALDMGLLPETFTRRKALPSGLKLTEAERELFTGRHQGNNIWIAKRIELNAMTGPELIDYIELCFKRAGAAEKLLPPQDVVRKETNTAYSQQLQIRIAAEIEKRLRLSEIAAELADNLPVPNFDNLYNDIDCMFATNPPQNWREILMSKVNEAITKTINDIDFSHIKNLDTV